MEKRSASAIARKQRNNYLNDEEIWTRSINIIGLIAYHAAYNYGSVLQAYATQSTITDMGHDVTVIDYRPLEGANATMNAYIGVGWASNRPSRI